MSYAPSVTLSVFDKRLTRRERFLALACSLAINLFLPFVNGMMLGFGEIFAKKLLKSSLRGWLVWKLKGTRSAYVPSTLKTKFRSGERESMKNNS